MIRTLPIMIAALGAIIPFQTLADENRTSLQIYDHAIYFDGYNTLEGISDASKAMIDWNDGILRHSTSLYAVKLTDEQLATIGENLSMLVEIGALCDNYDRIGNINLALVPKGAESYNPDETTRLEIGRFITPFMNKNIEPTSVPYNYDIKNVSSILRDMQLREQYDIWVEFELFGIPYAANQQVRGCADRQDVFTGTLTFITDPTPAPAADTHVLVPIVMKKPEHKGGNFNTYGEGCTDTPGRCVKTWTFDVPEDVTDSHIVLITSNHGANAGGEEYNRREHRVFFDGHLTYIYTPGRESCEPFRQYNTQPNGIYGRSPMTDAEWQSFSNWCPGDVIDNRVIHLGPLAKGEHAVKIRVNGAKFANNQGDIPVSMYFQGVTEGEMPHPASVDRVQADHGTSISINGDVCGIGTQARVIRLYDIAGNLLEMEFNASEVSLAKCGKGVGIMLIEHYDGENECHKIIR